MKYTSPIFAILLLIPVFSNAIDFTVVRTNGAPLVQSEVTKTWIKVKKGDIVKANSIVRLAHADYLLISANENNAMFEFNLIGTYNLKDYENKTIVLDDLGKTWQQIAFDSLNAFTPKRQKLYDKNLIDVQTDDDLFSIYPSPTLIYDPEIELKWRPMDENIYQVKLFFSKNSVYFFREVNTDHIKINLFELHLPTDRCLYWTVKVKGSKYESKPKCIYILNISETSNIEVLRYQLEEQLNIERSAIHNLMLAMFYEKNKVMHKAENHYKLAYDLANRENRYKQIYYNFLDRRNDANID